MGLRFRKSVKIAPGVKLNFGKKSTGITFGGKGMKYTINSSGKETTTVGIPGTGISYSQSTTAKKKSRSKKKSTVNSATPTSTINTYNPKTYRICGKILIVISSIVLLIGLVSVMVGGWVFLPIGALLMYLGIKYVKMGKPKEQASDKTNVNPET